MYSMGDFQCTSPLLTEPVTVWQLHVAYTCNGCTFALGGQDSNSATDTELAASVGGTYRSQPSVSLHTRGPTTALNGDQITFWQLISTWAQRQTSKPMFRTRHYLWYADENNSYGIDFNHDLGGGTSSVAVLQSVAGHTVADLGVRFNF